MLAQRAALGRGRIDPVEFGAKRLRSLAFTAR